MLLSSSGNRAIAVGLGLLRRKCSTMAKATDCKLANKVAIVTASTDGIGYAIARRLALDGCNVVISSRKEANVVQAVDKMRQEICGKQRAGQIEGVVCHVGEEADRVKLLQTTLDKFGGLDCLISNAAANPHFGNALDCSESQWDKIFSTNVKAAFLLTKLVVPEMIKRGGGSIVYVSSVFLGPYSVSKTALLGLTKAISSEVANDGIRVNCIAPGIIKTKFSDQLTGGDMKDVILSNLHIKRFGEPDEMAGLASFLCSDDASYITGETIAATGGATSRL